MKSYSGKIGIVVFLSATTFLASCSKEDTIFKVDNKSNPPVVVTGSVTDITSGTATVDGSVPDDGGSEITAVGICWNTSPDPTILCYCTFSGTTTGTFVAKLTGLSGNTVYYARTYATNSKGTFYGQDVSFKTLPVITAP